MIQLEPDVHERELKSELTNAFTKALAGMHNLTPDGKSNRGAYVTLSALLEAVRPIMAKEGLAVSQDCKTEDGQVWVRTIVSGHGYSMHGEWLGMKPAGATGQELGAAIAFLRRFSLQTLLCITGGDDDSVVDRGQVAQLGAAYSRSGLKGRDERLAFAEKVLGRVIESTKELTAPEVAKLINALDEMRP